MFHIVVNNKEQLNSLFTLGKEYCSRIYLDYIPDKDSVDKLDYYNIEVYAVGPYVFRSKDINVFKKYLSSYAFKGILVRDVETLGYINQNKEQYSEYSIIIDNSIYTFNHYSSDIIKEIFDLNIDEFYNSYELNIKETEDIYNGIKRSSVVYGRIPMMISANCVSKTLDHCIGINGFLNLNDRKNMNMPIYRKCDYCYNIVYNSIVLSLHSYIDKLSSLGNLRIDLTNEDFELTKKVIVYFNNLLHEYHEPFYRDFTTGHIKRGVE